MDESELDPTNPEHRQLAAHRNRLAQQGFARYIEQWERGVLSPREFANKVWWKVLEIEQTTVAEARNNHEVPKPGYGFRLN